MDEQNTGSAGMTYFKWFCDQARLLRGHVGDGLISYEDVGKLFLAVMHYVDTGEEPTFSGSSAPMLKMLFSQHRLDADRAKAAYEKKSATNRANGSKGGKAKAANAAAKKASAETEAEPEAPEAESKNAKFKPPTLTQFRDVVKSISRANGDEEHSAEEIRLFADRAYDDLKEANWIYCGKKITSRGDWENLAEAMYDSEIENNGAWLSILEISCKIFANDDNASLRNLCSMARDFTHECFKTVSDDRGRKHLALDVGGKIYEWDYDGIIAALRQYIEADSEDLGVTLPATATE